MRVFQGGIDEYEGALAAAQRELQEETGVTSARVVNMVCSATAGPLGRASAGLINPPP